jgi:ATP-binding cassette subfamily B protein
MMRLLSGAGFVLTFVVGGLWALSGPPLFFASDLTTGQFVAFILLTQQFVWPMADFGDIINIYQRAHVSAGRVFGLMDEPSRLPVADDAPPLDLRRARVEFDGVSFGYGSGDDPVLDGVTFAVERGETLALVGPSGSGKSTLLKLLVRLYDPDEGTIRVDGQDVSTVDPESLRRRVGYVGQGAFMFYGTVKENIAYGTFDATDEEIVEAAKRASAHEFVSNLPDGYDTIVGERGGKLSGGQRQRLSIARVILQDPDVLVLDEATSAVDTETELLIQRSVADLAREKTTFAIAHRLSTVRDADEILVLDEGRIVERGGHEELLDEGGLYAHLWRAQTGETESLSRSFIERAARRGARSVSPPSDD